MVSWRLFVAPLTAIINNDIMVSVINPKMFQGKGAMYEQR